MKARADRLDLRLSLEDKNGPRRAAELHGLPLATFVREAALREAETTIAHPPKARRGSLFARLRGRTTAGVVEELGALCDARSFTCQRVLSLRQGRMTACLRFPGRSRLSVPPRRCLPSRSGRSLRKAFSGMNPPDVHLDLPPRATVAGFPVLMSDNKDLNSAFADSIYNGVRKDPKRKSPAPSRNRCAQGRVLDQESGNVLELGEEPPCYERPSCST
jgi:hypothetical protein